MKFVELVDNEGKVHYVNPDQICSIQPIFSVSGPKDRGPEGSRVRINGYTRALLFDEVPIDVIDTIHVQAISGGVAKFHAQEPGVRRGPEPSPYVAGPASMSSGSRMPTCRRTIRRSEISSADPTGGPMLRVTSASASLGIAKQTRRPSLRHIV